MTDTLTRKEASDSVGGLGWRYVLGGLRAAVAVTSLAQAAGAAAHLAGSLHDNGSLSVDLRPDRVLLTLTSPRKVGVTAFEVDLARRIAAAIDGIGLRLEPHSVQGIEIAIDALDIGRIRPFWKAVLAYEEEPGAGPKDAIVDPRGQAPTIWFQQMDAPRPQRNRIHLDVSVPHDEAPQRIQAALEADGVLVSDAHAPAFWVLADGEGNEACVTTWQGRD